MKKGVCKVCETAFTSPKSRGGRVTCYNPKCKAEIIRQTHKGKIHSRETRSKISAANKGRKLTPEQRQAKSCPGSKNGRWIDGRSRVPDEIAYLNFTKARKRDIKERDGNACKVCKKGGKLHIHHIDGNKKNDRDDNFITLCGSCHSRVHGVRSPDSGDMELFGQLWKMMWGL